MVSRKNYNLNANEDFVIFLTSKLITCFIGGFTIDNETPVNCSFTQRQMNTYIRFWTLRAKCTQYGICE